MYVTAKNTENIVQGRCINATDRGCGCTSNIKTVVINKQGITVLIVLIRFLSWYLTEMHVIPDNAMPVFKCEQNKVLHLSIISIYHTSVVLFEYSDWLAER